MAAVGLPPERREMIKVNKGSVDINGESGIVVAEIMCLIKSFTEKVLIPKWGSKENARAEFDKMVDRVFEAIEE